MHGGVVEVADQNRPAVVDNLQPVEGGGAGHRLAILDEDAAFELVERTDEHNDPHDFRVRERELSGRGMRGRNLRSAPSVTVDTQVNGPTPPTLSDGQASYSRRFENRTAPTV